MTERLADWLAIGLEFLPCRAVLVPGFRKLGDADRFEPRFAVGILRANDAPRNAKPSLAVVGDGSRFLIKAALVFTDFIGNFADVRDAVGIKLRSIVQCTDDVRARA
jgi:hypothetical protein